MSGASGQELTPGTLVDGRYRVTATIARGGMGAVYDALDMRLERAVALKLLRPELAAEQEARKRFEREALMAARLGHPNIAQVLDFGRLGDGTSFMVMERVPGETLARLLERERRVVPLRAADIVRQGLEGLEAAHAAGIVHRDIKPGNVMTLREAGGRDVVKVLDFGVARLMETQAYTRLTSTGVIVGTPAYMAPEQARGDAVDARTDVHAMGVLLYCLVAGRKPFDGDVVSILEGVLHRAPPPLGDLAPASPPGLVAIVERALRKDPLQRFASAADMARALAGLSVERPASVQRTSLMPAWESPAVTVNA
ncbi:MAG: serine/threonine protein kinase, partial [Deltaproteobacteria bacterium]|nr:serine/threonine protein kinase [Deltaproteobacteria bacterium]